MIQRTEIRIRPHFALAWIACLLLSFSSELLHGQEKDRDEAAEKKQDERYMVCLLYTSPSPRDQRGSRMPSSA